jgi:glycolate oxidase FAD binding subunit
MSAQQIVDAVKRAAGSQRALRIAGGGSKAFYGHAVEGEVLDTRSHQGIAGYEPTELVITAKCGTPLAEVEKTLAENGQMLPFEPPYFGGAATFGGAIAAGLSGPRRAASNGYYGAVRDFVLGCKIVDGKGEVLSFGGQVMKNVAGYDVSRMMAGSMGTLGVILEVSLKVLPKPVAAKTLQLGMRNPGDVIKRLNEWGGQPLPITATAYCDGDLAVRLEGAEAAVHGAAKKLGGELVDGEEAETFWRGLRDQTDVFFTGSEPLWRLSVPSATVPLDLPGRQLIEWGGALRWLKSDAPVDAIRLLARQVGGHATLFRADDKLKREAGVFMPLDPVLARIHKNLKATFDPQGIFNRGRMYPDF